MRLFLAIDVNETIKQYCNKIQERLKPSTIKGNYTNYFNFHITLKYIGQSSDEEYQDLVELLDDVAKETNPFSIELKGLQSFKRKNNYVLWVGIGNGKQSLQALYNAIEQNATALGFEPDTRSYTPHITVARNVKFHSMSSSYVIPATSISYNVESIVLMRSHRVNGVLTYTPLYRASLL